MASLGRGVAGQANYGYANAACEMLALARRRDGLPAHVLAWAAVDDAGYVAEVLQVCSMELNCMACMTTACRMQTIGSHSCSIARHSRILLRKNQLKCADVKATSSVDLFNFH